MRLAACLLIPALCLAQNKYTGPRPTEPDVPFLLHAAELIRTEVLEAKEEQGKDMNVAAVSGAASPVRTPLAEPIFLYLSEKVPAEKLQLYRLNVKGGRREVAFPNSPKKMKDAQRPLPLNIMKLAPGLYRLEAAEQLDNGEYCLSPSGANSVFCFQVF